MRGEGAAARLVHLRQHRSWRGDSQCLVGAGGAAAFGRLAPHPAYVGARTEGHCTVGRSAAQWQMRPAANPPACCGLCPKGPRPRHPLEAQCLPKGSPAIDSV